MIKYGHDVTTLTSILLVTVACVVWTILSVFYCVSGLLTDRASMLLVELSYEVPTEVL